MNLNFQGYRRPDGRVGIRNHLLILSCDAYANVVARRISQAVQPSVAVMHQHGVNQAGEDAQQTFRTLAGTGRNPNVGGCLVVGMGSDVVDPHALAEAIAQRGKPVEVLDIPSVGGSVKAIEVGKKLAESLRERVAQAQTEECHVSDLIVSLECGGSDATSGLVSNPAVGAAADRVVWAGGTAMLSETTEIIGAEHILAARAVNEEVAQRLLYIVDRFERRVLETGYDMRGGNPAPGNIKGGLSTIEEKSLGCIAKAGSTPLVGVLEYAEEPTGKGLYFMDTPGNDVESMCGMVAGGSQVILFTTGRGTPTGNPIAPVIKVTANPATAKAMADNIDVDASPVLFGEASIDDMGEAIFQLILEVARGKQTKAELLGHHEFSINRLALTI